MNKIALFDFCETLVRFQTADAFVDYVRRIIGNRKMCWLESVFSLFDRFHILDILDATTRGNYSLSKRFKLIQLRNIESQLLEKLSYQYYHDMIKPGLISVVVDELIEKKKDGFEIILVSGGYDIYLKHFASEYGVRLVLSSKIKMKKGVCTGMMDGKDCMNDNKVKCLNSTFDRNSVFSVAYSDSESDLPMLNWANLSYVISKDKSQNWAKYNNLKEIIWDSSKN